MTGDLCLASECIGRLAVLSHALVDFIGALILLCLKIQVEQRVARNGVDLFTAEVMVVLISASGKPLRLTTALREALQAS